MEGNAENSVGTIKIPEGKVLKDFRFFCKKHGDITEASLVFTANYITPDGKQVHNPNVYCIACLNEYLESLQKEGLFPPVAIVPVVGKPEEDGKLKYNETK